MKPQDSPRRIGLARALSKLGYCSRSRAVELIRAGDVRVNEKECHDPESPVRRGRDSIVVKGQLAEEAPKIYLVMNKPRGVVTTASDEKGRETVYDVLEKSGCTTASVGNDSLPWTAPVGRLDKASEGLLLLTNDSEWGARVVAPETHLEKIYHVQIATLADDELLRALVRGVEVAEGKEKERLRVRGVSVLRSGKKNCWLEIVLDEGKNRQIRRMLVAFGIEVVRLVRVAIGPIVLGDLAKGDCRALTAEEKQSLDRAMQSRVGETRTGAHG